MPASAAEIVREEEIESGAINESPPDEANYREAEIDAIACTNCTHYEERSQGDEGEESTGVCLLWEAAVGGAHVCDRFTIDSSQHDEEGKIYEFSALEMFQPGDSAIELTEEDGLIWKDALRTGEWSATPTDRGKLDKTLKVVRDGESDIDNGIVSLQELVDSFNEQAYQYVTIPLTDEESKEHKNIARLNTGFVKKLKIEDRGPISVLRAGLNFTEPDVRGKVRRGTIPDVSAGIHRNVKTPAGKLFRSALNHLALSKQPFADGMQPFGVMASDDGDEEPGPEKTEGFVPKESGETEEGWQDHLSFSWQRDAIGDALRNQFNLPDGYSVEDISENKAVIKHSVADTSWEVAFELTDEDVVLDPLSKWKLQGEQEEEAETEGSKEPTEPAAAPETVVLSDESNELQQAQRLRKLRFSSTDNSEGGGHMSGTITPDKLDSLDFSDESQVEQAKKTLKETLEENQRLRSEKSKGAVDTEVERVSALFGDQEVPGFLRVYRDILMSDDQQPAAVLLSHDDSGNETKKEQVTISEVAKRLVEALPTEEKDGKTRIMLSGQALTSETTTHDKPEEDEQPDEEERTKAAAEEIGQKMPDAGGKE